MTINLKSRLFPLFLSIVLVVIAGCGDDNLPPEVEILTPEHNSSFQIGNTVIIEVEASDPDGTVAELELGIDGFVVSFKQSGSLVYEWNTVTATTGAHTITAIATDNDGLSGSQSIIVFINPR